jgi:HSP20 family protein
MATTDPFTNLKLFEDAFTRLLSEPRANRPWSPPVDVYETENELVFRADLPGVSSGDLDVRVENQNLKIAGERKFDRGDANRGFHRIERNYGNFVRSFAVPDVFDTEKVNAAYKDGVLTVTLAKKETAKPRQVKVRIEE